MRIFARELSLRWGAEPMMFGARSTLGDDDAHSYSIYGFASLHKHAHTHTYAHTLAFGGYVCEMQLDICRRSPLIYWHLTKCMYNIMMGGGDQRQFWTSSITNQKYLVFLSLLAINCISFISLLQWYGAHFSVNNNIEDHRTFTSRKRTKENIWNCVPRCIPRFFCVKTLAIINNLSI